MRRTPQQSRSQERVNRILDAAAEVFGEVGYDNATTNAIADRAGTSIGSLYRFFPDKSAIFQALCERYVRQLGELYDRLLTPQIARLPLKNQIDLWSDAYEEFFMSQPGYRAIVLAFSSAGLAPEIQEMGAELDRQLGTRMVDQLAQQYPEMPRSRLELIVTIVITVTNALDLLAVTGDDEFRRQIGAESKILLYAYLSHHFPDRS